MYPFFSLSRPIPTVSVPLLAFPANDIETPGVAVEAALPVEWLERELSEAEATARSAGELKGRISRSGKADMVVRGRIRASVELPCARCLGATPVVVDAELSLLLKPCATPIGKASPSNRGVATAHRAPPQRAVPHRQALTTKPVPADAATAKAPAKKVRAAAPKPPPPAKRVVAAEYEFSSEEADLDEYDGERVVLDSFVREVILLELPSFPLCKEDCDGGAQAAELSRARERLVADEAAQKKSPFEALRHLMDGSPLPSDDSAGNEGGSSAAGQAPGRRASAAEVRRATRAQSRGKPMIRSSIVGRAKK